VTVAPHAPSLACRDVEEALAVLRARGLRVTASRRLVLQALFRGGGDPVSAEALAGGLELDLGSVYRNLEALEQQGLVRHVHLGHGPGLYARVVEGQREYLYCVHCHAVRAVPPDQLDLVRDAIRERFGYEASFSHFPITGACPDCAAP
jgi:Fur family ferric uptake transcriptional regulator